MATKKVFGDLPCVPVDVRSGRSIVREFDFTRDGKTNHVKRQALQVSFVDCWGFDSVAVAAPVWGFDLDIKEFERQDLRLYVTELSLDNSGVCVFRVCGFEPVPARELKQK